ncbi:hypothetical protein AMTRI_Chr11g93460 [Amborella trichopoda]
MFLVCKTTINHGKVFFLVHWIFLASKKLMDITSHCNPPLVITAMHDLFVCGPNKSYSGWKKVKSIFISKKGAEVNIYLSQQSEDHINWAWLKRRKPRQGAKIYNCSIIDLSLNIIFYFLCCFLGMINFN